MDTGCFCKEDYFHLKSAREGLELSHRSMGYPLNEDSSEARDAVLAMHVAQDEADAAIFDPQLFEKFLCERVQAASEGSARTFRVEVRQHADIVYACVLSSGPAGKLQVDRGPLASSASTDCRFTFDIGSARQVYGGRMSARAAFVSGKLIVAGDTDAARYLQSSCRAFWTAAISARRSSVPPDGSSRLDAPSEAVSAFVREVRLGRPARV